MSKIYYLSEMEEFYGADEWRMQIDVTDIWNKYDKKETSLKEFNTEYQNRLLKYKTDIVNLGTDVWNDVVPLINKMNENLDEEGITDLWESIYDWADKNDILIKTK
jgi:hypothetical protein